MFKILCTHCRYDPLVDWSAHKEEDIERADQELDVSMDLFASRMAEEVQRPELASGRIDTAIAQLAAEYERARGLWTTLAGLRTMILDRTALVRQTTLDIVSGKKTLAAAAVKARATAVALTKSTDAKDEAAQVLDSDRRRLRASTRTLHRIVSALSAPEHGGGGGGGGNAASGTEGQLPSNARSRLWLCDVDSAATTAARPLQARPIGDVCRTIIEETTNLGRGTKRKMKVRHNSNCSTQLRARRVHRDRAWRGVVALHCVAWRCIVWCGVAWRCYVALCGVAWRGVAWRGVAWRCIVVAWRCCVALLWRGIVVAVLLLFLSNL